MSTTPVPIKLNYTSKEFNSILNDIKSKLTADVNSSEWNDFFASNVGRAIMDVFAAIGDMLCFYIDRQASETYIDTALIRTNVFRILQLIGFQPNFSIPALTSIQFLLSSTITNNIVIPQYTRLQDQQGNQYVTAQTGYIPAGMISAVVPAVQGQFNTFLLTSDGTANQAYLLSQSLTNAAQGYVIVTVNGVAWNQALNNTFVGYSPSDQVFRVIHNPDDTMTIEFGDGVEGSIPPASSPITVKVLVTEGAGINIGIGGITNLLDSITDSLSNPITLQVTNVTRAYGGSDPEDVDSARSRYSSIFQTLNRAVTLSDYQTLVNAFPGVLQGRATDVDIDNTLSQFEIVCYILPSLQPVVSTPIGSITQGGNTVQGFTGLATNAYVNFTVVINNESHTIISNSSTTLTIDGTWTSPTGTTYTAQIFYSNTSAASLLQTQLSNQSVVGNLVSVLPAGTITVNVNAGIYVARGYAVNDGGAAVQSAVVAAVNNFFTLLPLGEGGNVEIGKTLFFSQLLSTIQGVPGVSAVEMNSPLSDIIPVAIGSIPAVGVIPQLGSVVITVLGVV